jgi:hypothetical protein
MCIRDRVYIYSNGTVSFPLAGNVLHEGISSLPIPQKFIVYRQHGEEGTGIKFVNELDQSVTGPLVLQVPEGAKIDPEHTNITYTVLGERDIGGNHYILINASIPEGISQITAVKEADTKPPEVKIGYLSPSKPKPGRPFKVYLSVNDNVGIKDVKVQIIKDGKVIAEYPAFSMKPSETKSTYLTDVPGVDATEFTLKVIATDFYGNTAEATQKVGGATSSTTTTSSTSSAQSTGQSSGSTCGPAALVALALAPALLRRRK